MDPALLKERAAFKKKSIAATEIKIAKPKPLSEAPSRPKPKKAKSKINKLLPNRRYKHLTGINDDITRAAELAFRTDNPARLFKAIVDMMKERYLTKVFDPLGMEEILRAVNLTELKKDRRDSLYQALKNNTKMHYYPEVDKFIFLPALGHSVRNREQLLRFLKEREKEGLGGLAMAEVVDSVPNSGRAIKKLNDDIFRIPRGAKDKDEILFYNNKEYEVQIDEVFVGHWRSIGVEGQSEADIEKYLQNVGLSAMQGESRKRKAPTTKKSRKKARQTKVLNTHLNLLQDYTDDGTQMTTPTK